ALGGKPARSRGELRPIAATFVVAVMFVVPEGCLHSPHPGGGSRVRWQGGGTAPSRERLVRKADQSDDT
ncbi:hypothetical protein, partial [Streptomonospora salina]|uniref:hypothetical protein n=1 Tax=Streptomonospora salina TaxID=104205 RepID=UPI0035EB1610